MQPCSGINREQTGKYAKSCSLRAISNTERKCVERFVDLPSVPRVFCVNRQRRSPIAAFCCLADFASPVESKRKLVGAVGIEPNTGRNSRIGAIDCPQITHRSGKCQRMRHFSIADLARTNHMNSGRLGSLPGSRLNSVSWTNFPCFWVS